MMKTIPILLSVIAVLCISGCKTTTHKEGDVTCHIEGVIRNRQECKELFLQLDGSDPRVQDVITIPVTDSTFSYDLHANWGDPYILFLDNEYYRGSMNVYTIFAEEGSVHFTIYEDDGSGEGYEYATVLTECPLTDRYHNKIVAAMREKQENDPLLKELAAAHEDNSFYSDKFNELLGKLQEAQGDTRDSLYSVLNALQTSGEMYSEKGKLLMDRQKEQAAQEDARIRKEILSHPDPIGLYRVYQQLEICTYSPDKAGMTEWAEVYTKALKPEFSDTYLGQKIEGILAAGTVSEGAQFIDFSAPDADGTVHTLSEEIKGKVALVDLWASWCGPCRRKAKATIPLYEKYKDKGFTVVGVAREKKLQDMVRAASRDGYPWLNLVELNDEGKIWEKYGAGNSGGMRILVDRDGTILLKDPSTEELQARLEEIFE